MLQPHFLHFFSSISSFYHLVTKSVSVDGLWAPMFHKFVCCCHIGMLCELVCQHLFFLFQLLSTIFHLHSKSFHTYTYTTCRCYCYQKHEEYCRHSVKFPQTSSGIHFSGLQESNSRKKLKFLFFHERTSFTNKNCCKIIPQP